MFVMRLHAPYLLLYASGVMSVLLSHTLPFFEFSIPFAVRISVCALGVLCALAIGVWARRVIVQGNTALSPYGTPTTFIEEGPFRYSRNPMYVSYVMTVLSVAVVTQSLWAFVPPILYFLYLNGCVIPKEEQKLYVAFPEGYKAYACRVRRWL